MRLNHHDTSDRTHHSDHLSAASFTPHPAPSRTSLLQRTGASVALVLMGAGIATASNYFIQHHNTVSSQSTPIMTTGVPTTPFAPAPVSESPIPTTSSSNFVQDVVKRVGPAVVRIDASRTVTRSTPEIFNDPFFQQFFGNQMPTAPSQQIERGVGSGFISTADGRIITNAHVIDGADTVQVTLQDGRTFEGRVMGTDPVTDVAVVKIEANNLPTVAFSNSDAIAPGEWAIAIGNPLGLDSTVTVGIISATGRSSGQVGVPDKRVDFIQTDAAINPGNSGGPLLNAEGQVIGMNTAIIQGAQGIGFAIPINTVQRIADELASNGEVEHAYLGVQMVTLSPEIKEEIDNNPNSRLSVDVDKGVLVVRVMPNSPAARAGLRSGDVISKVNNQEIATADELQKLVEASQVGSNLQLHLKRNDQDLTIAVQPGAFPTTTQQN